MKTFTKINKIMKVLYLRNLENNREVVLTGQYRPQPQEKKRKKRKSPKH